MIPLRETVSTIHGKIQQYLSSLKDPLRPDEATNSHLDDEGGESLSTLHRLVLSRMRANTSASTSSSTPSPSQPNDGERATKVMESVITTLFGVCSGTHQHCPANGPQCPNPYCEPNPKSRQQHHRDVLRTIKKRNRRSSSFPMVVTPTTSPKTRRDECCYAQFHKDDHVKAAKAVQAAHHLEERQKNHRHKRIETIIKDVEGGAQKIESFRNNQRQERIRVGGKPYKLCEVDFADNTSGVSLDATNAEEEDAVSYNYDDGISALSAHTLEEMVNRDPILGRQERTTVPPSEQGLDIAKDEGINSKSPLSTKESLKNDEEVQCVQSSEEYSKEGSCGDESRRRRKATYPVQMARNQSTTSNMTFSTKSSKSDFSDVWKRQEQQYWMQVVEEDGPVEFPAASKAAEVS